MSGKYKLTSKKKFLFNFVFFLVIITPFIGLEYYVRSTGPFLDLWVLTGRKTGPNPIKTWGMVDAFSGYRARPGEYSSNKTVNRLGFISTPEITVAKPSNTIRIVFLGGSSTAGTGKNLADTDTWPWQVTELLKLRYPNKNFEFINGAVGGYTSFESYGRLWSRIRFFSPDIIVVCHGWNEMGYFNNVDSIISWRTLADGDWSIDKTDARIEAYKPLAIDYLVRPSQTLTYLRLRLSEPVGGEIGVPKPLESDYDHRGLAIWRTNLSLIREAAKIIGADLFVIKQSTMIVPNLPLEDRESIRYEYHGFDHNAHVDAFNQIYRVIEEEIDSERIIDGTVISGKPEYFYDHVHPTELGSARIAEYVTDELTTYLNSILLDLE